LDGGRPWQKKISRYGNGGFVSERPAMPSEHLAPLLSALRDLMTLFKDRQIPATIIGGIAASILGRPRVTRDIDALVMLDGEAWEGLLIASRQFGFSPRLSDALQFARTNRVLLLRHEPSGIDVDIAFGGLPFEEETIKRASSVSVGDISITLPSPEDLIIMKAVAHRPRDIADIEGIVDAHPNLDEDRIRMWIAQFAEMLEMPEILSDTEKILSRKL
jgi:hypothetical protein